MQLERTLGTVTLLAVLLLSMSWMRAPSQAGAAQAKSTGAQRLTPIGVWDVTGVAESDTRWIATLVLRSDDRDAQNAGLVGHIDWLGNSGASGREHVAGNYDARTHVLTLKGTRVEYSDRVVRCTYKVELSRDGAQLENGRWTDNDPTIPGTWGASRIQLR